MTERVSTPVEAIGSNGSIVSVAGQEKDKAVVKHSSSQLSGALGGGSPKVS